MTKMTWPIKDVSERLDYGIDWTDRLGEDFIVASNFEAIGGDVIVDTQYFNNSVSTVWLRGGTAGQIAQVRCTIETDQGRKFSEVVQIPIVDRAA